MSANYSTGGAESIAKRWAPIALIVAAMIGLKLALLAADAVPFNSDEAVVGLMARHIRQGERPVFFYGQAYLGSLDTWLVAISFSIFGDSVASIRIVQIALYAGVTITAYLLARRILADEWAARATALLFAIPIPLVTTYTTATLGGYGETLLIGHLLLLLTYRLGNTAAPTVASNRLAWFPFGLLAGVGFWTAVMTMVYVVPAALWLTWNLRRRIGPGVAIAAVAFFIGSAPWWAALVELRGAPLREMLGLSERGITIAESYVQSVGLHVLYFVIFGLPVLFGLRFPWSADLIAPVFAPIALAISLAAIWRAARCRRTVSAAPLWGIVACLTAGFLLTSFGNDPSGRYFLPLYLPLSIFIADLLSRLRAHRAWAGQLSLAALLGYNLLGNGLAASTLPPGITTQFDPVTSIEWRRDRELIDFLVAHDATRGYSNYWITFRIAFESDEIVIFAPRLPYHTDFRYTPHDDRYPAYSRQVDAAPHAAYITTHFPELDARIRAGLGRLGVTYAETQIADYHIFYDLSRKVVPEELRLGEVMEVTQCAPTWPKRGENDATRNLLSAK